MVILLGGQRSRVHMVRPETSLRDLVGEQLGPYRLVRRLGIGGMAETFEAIRSGPSGFEQRVCLKLVLPFFHQDANFVELFHREAKLAARLRHSNIVGVIDFGEVDGRSYMALELVDGCDLRVLLDARDRIRLPSEYVALIGLDLAAALEHAHNPEELRSADDSGAHLQGIVHRDISPSNVLVSSHGEILLTDFGVAKAISGTARKQSAVKGKIPYMSPEQLRGEVVDGRSDLFALGVVLFEALSGQRPYDGPSDPATIMLILKGEHPSLQTFTPNAPTKLCEVIEKLLEPDAERRMQTAEELVEALDDFTPSRRVRRKLGGIAAQTPRAAEALLPDVSSAIESTGGSPSAGEVEEHTGVGRKKQAAVDTAHPGATTARVPEEQSGAPERSTTPGRASVKSRRRAMITLAAVTLGIGGVAAFGLWTGEQGADGSATVDMGGEPELEGAAGKVGTPASLEEEPDVPGEAEGKQVEAVPPPEPITAVRQTKIAPPPPAPARLTVVAIPWGNVWIDGKPQGASPLKNRSLKAGRYKISVGQGSPSKSQTIRLRPGQRRTVQFDLTD
jgi:serine/threonine protein kinase